MKTLHDIDPAVAEAVAAEIRARQDRPEPVRCGRKAALVAAPRAGEVQRHGAQRAGEGRLVVLLGAQGVRHARLQHPCVDQELRRVRARAQAAEQALGQRPRVLGPRPVGVDDQVSPRMKASTAAWAASSVICRGGCLHR